MGIGYITLDSIKKRIKTLGSNILIKEIKSEPYEFNSLIHDLLKIKAYTSLRYNRYQQLRKYRKMHIKIFMIYYLKHKIEIIYQRISLINSMKMF